MVSYYVCDGFSGADALAVLRNLPTWSWLFPAFAILDLPNSLLVIVPFIMLFIAFVWGLRGTVRLFARSKA